MAETVVCFSNPGLARETNKVNPVVFLNVILNGISTEIGKRNSAPKNIKIEHRFYPQNLIAKLINVLIFIYSIWHFLVFMNKVENWVTLHQYCPTQPQRLSLQTAQKLKSAAPRIR